MGYSSISWVFLLSNVNSIISVLLLIAIILKSSSYITKWTLFQVCLAILGSSVSSLLKVLKYGDDYDNLDQALDQSICIIQQKLSMLFFYPLYLLPSVLAFYLWFGMIKMNSSVEKSHFWTLTVSIWGFACVYTSAVTTITAVDKNRDVMVTRLVCEAYDFSSSWYFYWPTQLVVIFLAFISLIFAIRSTAILWKIWSAYNLNEKGSGEIQIGYAVRMIIFIYLYCMMLFFHITSEIRQQSKSNRTKSYIDDSYYPYNFTSSLFGTLVFLIFGATKSSLLSLSQYCGYKDKSNDSTLFVFKPSSYHSEPISVKDTRAKRTTRDTMDSEAVTIEILVESDHSSLLEKQKRTKHYSLEKFTKDNFDWKRYSNSSTSTSGSSGSFGGGSFGGSSVGGSSVGSDREHRDSRNGSKRRKRHSDIRHNASQRRRHRHRHNQDDGERKNNRNSDITNSNSRRVTIEITNDRRNSDTSNDRRNSDISNDRRNSDISNDRRNSDISNGRRNTDISNGRRSSDISNGRRNSDISNGRRNSDISNGRSRSRDIAGGNSRRVTIGNDKGIGDITNDINRKNSDKRTRSRINSDNLNVHTPNRGSYATSKGRFSGVSNNGRSSGLLYIDGIDERLEKTKSKANDGSSINSRYSEQDLQRIWGQL